MKSLRIVLITIIIAGGLVSGGTYYAMNKKATKDKNALQSQINDLNKKVADTIANSIDSWKTLSLSLTKSSIKYPSGLAIPADPFNRYPKQFIGYTINKVNTVPGGINEYNVNEWLKGPNPGEGYVLSATDRATLLADMKQIYTSQQLTSEMKQKLGALSGEFLTYSPSDRIYVGYIESKDGKARGLAMINTHGQDTGLTTDYTVSLYNQEQNAVFSIEYPLTGKEIDDLTTQYGDYKAANITQIDQNVHTAFTNLMKNTSRAQLSFGSQMGKIDLIAQSWTY